MRQPAIAELAFRVREQLSALSARHNIILNFERYRQRQASKEKHH